MEAAIKKQEFSVDEEFLKELSDSPKDFEEKTNTKARIEMKGFRFSVSEYYYWLKKEIGAGPAFAILLKASTWDMIFNKPKWKPELFRIESDADGMVWKKTFKKDVVPLIAIYRNLVVKYGNKKADEIIVRFIMPIGLQYQFFCFKPISNLTHINQFRQQMADYLGDGKTMRNRVWVSKDGSEVRYYYTKCMHIQIMYAYGLKAMAQASCMIDHVTFDKRIPNLKFKRTRALCLGDSCCDHRFEIRKDGDTITPYEYYEDAHRCCFNAYGEIMKLEEMFEKHGPKLRD